MKDMLKSFPEMEKGREVEKAGDLYTFNNDLRDCGFFLGQCIEYSKYDIAKKIFDKIEKFLNQADEDTKELVLSELFDLTIKCVGNEKECHPYFIEMLKDFPQSRECCAIMAKHWKIKIKGLE